ncbi:hypothetical protein PQR62_06120 [Herbaspirillum lusitanum]|uniref:AraC family transcriptional regulator n=1 Tax=Herbaspirillum lusitanum TaxID=213312 RepID=A0ABW9A625_9BURK
MTIVTHHTLHLTGLRFVRAARVRLWKGEAVLRSGGVTVPLKAGESFAVPAFIRFSCQTLSAGRPAMWSLALESGSDAMQAVSDCSKPWSRDLAQLIFAEPALQWTAAHVAEHWQIPTQKVRARLFAEGESLRSLLREQRVAHAFYRLACIDAGDSEPVLHAASHSEEAQHVASGFVSAAALADACLDTIGLPPDILQRAISLWPAAPSPPPSAPHSERSSPRYRLYF